MRPLFLFFLLFPVVTFANTSWQWTTPTPGEENNTATPLTTEKTASSNNIILSEIFPNPKGKDAGKEWIELEVLTSETVLPSLTLRLEDRTYKIPEQKITGSFLQLSLPPSFTLPNTTGTLILETSEGIEIDRLSYTTTTEEHSISRFCDPAFPTLCTHEESTPTPGEKNRSLPLTISANPSKKEHTRPFHLSLTGNAKDMRIFYTFSPESANMEDAREYTTPILIEDSSTIYYFGYRSLTERTSIEHLSFSFPSTSSPLLINEIAPEGWVELKNTGKPQSLTGYELTTTPENSECPPSTCQALTGEIPTGLQIEPLTFPLETPTTLTLRSPKGEKKDKVALSVPSGKSFARTSSSFQAFLEQEYLFSEYIGFKKDPFLWTDLPTKGADNVIIRYLTEAEDADRDFLKDREEETRGLSAGTQYQDKFLIPDTIKWQFSSASPETQKKQWEYLLEKITHIGEETGHTYPLSTLEISDKEGHIHETFMSNSFGIFTYATESPENLYLEHTFTGLLLPFPHNIPEVHLKEVLPNPTGKDTNTTEYLVIENTDRVPHTLSHLTLIINEKTIPLPSTSIAPGTTHMLTGKDLKTTLPNTTTTILLMYNENILSEFSYSKAEEGVLLHKEASPTPTVEEGEAEEERTSTEHQETLEPKGESPSTDTTENPSASPTKEETSSTLPRAPKRKTDLIWSILWSTFFVGNGFFFFPR